MSASLLGLSLAHLIGRRPTLGVVDWPLSGWYVSVLCVEFGRARANCHLHLSSSPSRSSLVVSRSRSRKHFSQGPSVLALRCENTRPLTGLRLKRLLYIEKFVFRPRAPRGHARTARGQAAVIRVRGSVTWLARRFYVVSRSAEGRRHATPTRAGRRAHPVHRVHRRPIADSPSVLRAGFFTRGPVVSAGASGVTATATGASVRPARHKKPTQRGLTVGGITVRCAAPAHLTRPHPHPASPTTTLLRRGGAAYRAKTRCGNSGASTSIGYGR